MVKEKLLLEIKNYSPFVKPTTGHNKVTTLNGADYLMGNTEERLKHTVLGTPQRGLPAMGDFDHSTGTGFVAAHGGDYRDAISNKKAQVRLLVHETTGGFSPFAAKFLRRLGREAATNGCDATDYSRSSTANSFVPYYAQYISSACVMNGAAGINAGIANAMGSVMPASLAPPTVGGVRTTAHTRPQGQHIGT